MVTMELTFKTRQEWDSFREMLPKLERKSKNFLIRENDYDQFEIFVQFESMADASILLWGHFCICSFSDVDKNINFIQGFLQAMCLCEKLYGFGMQD